MGPDQRVKSGSRFGWGFWLRWVIGSCIGAGAGVVFWVGIGSALDPQGAIAEATPLGYVVAASVGAAFGVPFGAAQWLTLRAHLHHAAWWVVATGLGYLFVFLVGINLFPGGGAVELLPGQQVLLGAALGAGVALPGAVLQWFLVLRRQVAGASRWVLASAVSWSIGFALSFALRLAYGELTFVAGPMVALGLTGLAMGGLLRRGLPHGP